MTSTGTTLAPGPTCGSSVDDARKLALALQDAAREVKEDGSEAWDDPNAGGGPVGPPKSSALVAKS